ncbi:MAG: protein kinase [Candidatus Zixiibacteriota bacterium]
MSDSENQDNLEQTRLSAPAATTVVGRYRIIEKIGAGGMGEVYLAFDPKLQRNVAIKVLPATLADDPETKARFIREAQTAASLNHNNIVTIYEVDEFEGRQFIAMELVEGVPLKDLMKAQRLPMENCFELILQICDGLAAAHERKIVHRDIKPANILVSGKGRVKILDFGLAKMHSVSGLTSTGVRLGTIAYMSPEQAQGAEVDHRSDIFSLGAVFYEMLTGQTPFKKDSEIASLLAILQQAHVPLQVANPEAPEEISNIVDRALQKDQAARYQHIEDFARDLRKFLRGPEQPVSQIQLLSASSQVSRASVIDASAVTKTSVGLKKAIAILPFENLGPTEHNYFAEGITDEITTSLAKIKLLKVISNSSARQFNNKDRSVPEIAAELGVEFLLTGTIRWDNSQTPSRFRLSCKLVDTKDESYLWAESYDRILEEIFSLQSELATEITKALGVALATPELDSLSRIPTANLEAYDYYLRGNEFYPRSTQPADISKAIEMYERAVELDPDFALAHVKLSLANLSMYWFFHDRTPARVARAKVSVDAAVSVAPQLPETSLALGYYYYYGCKEYMQALEQFVIAGKGRPNDSNLMAATGFVQRRLGFWNEALRNIRKAAELDPKSSLLASELGNTLMLLRQYDAAMIQFDRAIWLVPDWIDIYARKAQVALLRDGNVAAAAQVFKDAETRVAPAETVMEYPLLDVFVAYCGGDIQAAMDKLAIDEVEMELYFINKGRLARRAGRVSESKSYFESARVMLESKLRASPEDARYLANLGFASAGLGQQEKALACCQKAVELFPHDRDHVFSIVYLETYALTLTALGLHDQAIDQLKFLLSVPSYISRPLLMVSEDFAPLRGLPAFQKLLVG